MVGLDSSTPPVIFVVGTAGAGKSSLVTAFQRWSRFLETDAIAVNLDPGAERVHYDAEFDVRDLISLTEVMTEYDLGPNGAQILAADLLAAQAGDVAEQLHALSGELMIVDTPGQVELFAFREASNHLIEVLGRNQSAIIYLFDPMLSRSPSGFVSQMLLSSIVEFRLGLPTKNFLSKADLLEQDELEKITALARDKIAKELNLIDENVFAFCWIVDYPMFEKDEITNKIKFSHNPFSMPQGDLSEKDFENPLDILAYQYDIVCNGIELSSGAIRNHKPDLMYKLFSIAGYNKSQVDEKFSGMINALSYGAPPHGGIAPGIDRIVMLLANEKNIREVTMFPMNQNAQDLMMNAPSEINPEQLKELNLSLRTKK